jgi:hypothetical protein
MERPSRLRLGFSFCLGIVVCLAALELLLRALPVQNGLFGGEPRKDWPIHALIPNSAFTDSTGWNFADVNHGRINNLGYIAPFDYVAGSHGVVVMGNSFIASAMNPYADTLQGSLPQYLSAPQPVLGLGVAGAHMPDYLATARLAGERFVPDWAVIVVTATDFSGGFSADPGYCRWSRRADATIECIPEAHRPALRQLVRSLAIVRYVRANLNLSVNNLIQLRRAPPLERDSGICGAASLAEADQRLLSGFLDEIAPAFDLPAERIIFVLDSDRRAMYAAPGAAAPTCRSRDKLANDYLETEAMRRGMHVVNSEPVFASYVAERHQRLDFSPNDVHWNGVAHRLMAQQVARIINATTPSAR